MSRCLTVTAMLLAAASIAWAADNDKVAAKKPPAKIIDIGKVRVDLARHQVSFDAEVCLREGVLEFMIVEWQTKTHESLLQTKAKSSHLHAGLLMLGLTPGKPARWSGQDMGAMFLPPAGAALKMTVKWEDSAGKTHTADPGSWIGDENGQDVQPPDRWIFVGSDILPDGRYWAEVDGEMVSLSNFASAVLDVPFRSSSADADRSFCAKTDDVPPVGTKVEVILTPMPGAQKAPDARQMVEIDRFGHRRADGTVMNDDQLEKWASDYILAHDRGMVVVRADGLARVWDVAQTQSVLRLGGVREFDVQRVRPSHEILPRAKDQAADAIAEWKQKFANYRDLLEDPGIKAESTLKQIKAEIEQIEARKELLSDYESNLKKALKAYKAETQPKSPEAPK